MFRFGAGTTLFACNAEPFDVQILPFSLHIGTGETVRSRSHNQQFGQEYQGGRAVVGRFGASDGAGGFNKPLRCGLSSRHHARLPVHGRNNGPMQEGWSEGLIRIKSERINQTRPAKYHRTRHAQLVPRDDAPPFHHGLRQAVVQPISAAAAAIRLDEAGDVLASDRLTRQ